MSGDVRELFALLAPGAIDASGRMGGTSDTRQMLMGALARVRPKWAADLLLARYADDMGALKSVSYALTSELAGMVWPEKNKPGTLRRVVYMAMQEHVSPPPCLSCHGTASTWRMVDGAVAAIDCPSCQGRGRRRLTDDELAVLSGLAWDTWVPKYAHLRRMLRANERAALEVVREGMAEKII